MRLVERRPSRSLQGLQAVYPKVSTGLFQAKMLVTLESDGPVTFVLDEP